MKYWLDPSRDETLQRIKMTREGASVLRVHTQHGTEPYYDGMHTFNMLTMLRILNPEASCELIWAIVEHDVPSERFIGDVASPAKKLGILDRKVNEEAEIAINTAAYGVGERTLTPNEWKWLTGLDFIEYYFWIRDQLKRGDTRFNTKYSEVKTAIKNYAAEIHPKVLDIFYKAELDMWDTMSDKGLQHD